jgi:hypothetical protein
VDPELLSLYAIVAAIGFGIFAYFTRSKGTKLLAPGLPLLDASAADIPIVGNWKVKGRFRGRNAVIEVLGGIRGGRTDVEVRLACSAPMVFDVRKKFAERLNGDAKAAKRHRVEIGHRELDDALTFNSNHAQVLAATVRGDDVRLPLLSLLKTRSVDGLELAGGELKLVFYDAVRPLGWEFLPLKNTLETMDQLSTALERKRAKR